MRVIYLIFLSLFCEVCLCNEIADNTVSENNKAKKEDVSVENIVTVDLKRVAVNSLAGKSIDEQLFNINNEEKKSLIEFEDKIKKMDAENKDHDDRKSESARAMLYEMTRRKRNQIQSASQTAIETLDREIYEAIKEIVRERKIDLILVSDVVVYSKCLDITEEVTAKLDSRLTKIPVILKDEDTPLSSSSSKE